jgi:hypothetical protein
MNRMRMLLAVVGGIALLWGCSDGGTAAGAGRRLAMAGQSLKPAAPPAVDEQRAKDAPAQPGGGAATLPTTSADGLSNLPSQRMVIKTASLAVRVKDVPAAFARAVQLAEGGGGYVQSSPQDEEGGDRADVTIRVPPNGFLPLLAALAALGTQTSKTISGEDVTQEYYDLDAELSNQVEVRGRLLQLLRQAVKVQDAISVEEQLERVGANVNRIKGRMKYLETMTGLCTVNVSLYGEERAAVSGGFLNWGLVGHGFWRAAQVLVNVFFVLLQVLVVAIPLAAVGGAGTWGVIRAVRSVRRRRRPAANPDRQGGNPDS